MTAVDDAAQEVKNGGQAEASPARLREAMGHFATGVTVVTSVGADGEPVGTTGNAVTSLSLEPPLVLVCFDLNSATLAAIRAHGAFAVIECTTEQTLPGGDHEIVIGRVRHVETNGDGATPKERGWICTR